MEKSANRVSISEKDFAESISYLQEFNKHENDVVKRSLMISAVVAYSRPFSNNEKSAYATNTVVGNPKKILSTEGYELHKKIIEYRKKAIAHSDFENNPTRAVKRQPGLVLSWSKKFDILGEQIDSSLFLEIAEAMRSHCIQKIYEFNRRICSNNAAQPGRS